MLRPLGHPRGAAHGAGAGPWLPSPTPLTPPVLKGVQQVGSTARAEGRGCECGWQTVLQGVKTPVPGAKRNSGAGGTARGARSHLCARPAGGV